VDSGILKAVLLFVPVLGYIVWQILSLHRDPELRQTPSRSGGGHHGNDGESSHPDSSPPADSKG